MSAFGAKADLVNSMIGAECSATSVRGMSLYGMPKAFQIGPVSIEDDSHSERSVASRKCGATTADVGTSCKPCNVIRRYVLRLAAPATFRSVRHSESRAQKIV